MKKIAKFLKKRSYNYKKTIVGLLEQRLLKLSDALSEREKAIAEKEAALEALDIAIKAKEMALMERNDAIRDRDRAIKDAFIDSLTGCYNRNYFDKIMAENYDPEINHKRIALIFIDINNLKETNDKYGHDAGDKLIRDTAEFLKSNFRKKFDTVIRIGGDEFVIFCYNYRENDIFEEALTKKTCKCRNDSPLSFAFGVAVFDKDIDVSLEDTRKRADERMYKCKNSDKCKNSHSLTI